MEEKGKGRKRREGGMDIEEVEHKTVLRSGGKTPASESKPGLHACFPVSRCC